ncbi:MAG: hypothetical protein IJ735_00855 [Clostridia bacterium]|nr:hypothetical protein [Clostridia bacterium]
MGGVLLLIGSMLIGVFVTKYGVARFVESCVDFGVAVATWFCKVFGIEANIEGPSSSFDMGVATGVDSERIRRFFVGLVAPENLGAYFGTIGKILLITLPFIWVVLLVGYVVFRLLKMIYLTPNTRHNVDTVPLRIWKKISGYTYGPIKHFVSDYIAFLTQKKVYVFLFVLIWAVAMNIVTVLFELVAKLLLFSTSFDDSLFGTGFVGFVTDIVIFLRYSPKTLLIAAVIVVSSIVRKNEGYRRIENVVAKNEEILEDLPVVTLFVGKMGTGKDLSMTTLALMESVRFRDLAHERLVSNDLKFPYFPWILFETDLKKAIKDHRIFNKYTAKKFAEDKAEVFADNPTKENIYGYDFGRYGYEYDDGLRVQTVWDVLVDYAQLFFIYAFSSSMIIANHAIREDLVLTDVGNFPAWSSDFFSKHSDRERRAFHVCAYIRF